MSKQSYRYPRDEFDDIPEDSPIGVHRVPRSAWRKVVPFVAVAAVFGIVAFVGVTLWADGFGGGSATADDKDQATTAPRSTAKSTAKSTPKATVASTDGTEDDGGTSAADVDKSTVVAVKNVSNGVTGAAAKDAGTLEAAGFTSVTAGPYTGNAPPAVATVYYKTDDLKSTAAAVADALGIDEVVQTSNLSSPVLVVLAPAG
ncbi:LytR C-terminal domain-containing protein [Luteimicrobium subarcticum]|uniref:LytR cell envelope-related transcriptional attenuator n=1 Tax=Luteimicrobium subarcticum TaxID=620910 RepID=A0A2M8WSQ8_9MICO|nr:LytR C-terminal domain-containing protein [Luteimicrobium subarcticum]PJI93987.1 LytR cell envelope-related transcriptional attenuator [Luteimicrobium subarcticum]